MTTPASILADLQAEYARLATTGTTAHAPSNIPPATVATTIATVGLFSRFTAWLSGYFRASGIGLVALAAAVLVYWLAPAQAEVAAWKVAMIAAAVYGGYWADRHLFPYARPDAFLPFIAILPTAATKASTTAAIAATPAVAAVAGPFEGNAVAFVGAMIRRAVIIVGIAIAVGVAL